MNPQSFFDERKYSILPEEFPDANVYPLYYKATKTELVIKEGERLFIPAGWWHHVFSEKPGKEGLNIAVNYWYDTPPEWREGVSFKDVVPHKVKSSVPPPVLSKTDTVRVFKSTSRRFTSDRISYKYPGTLEVVNMKYDEFLKAKDPLSYILQYHVESIDQHTPKHSTRFAEASVWINFGNVYSHLHYDLYDNWLCQVKGTKRVILFRPEDRDYLYPLNPYPLDIIRQLEPRPPKTIRVLIGTYTPTGDVSFVYNSACFSTVRMSTETSVYVSPVTISTEAPENIIRNEFVHMMFKGEFTHLFLVHREVSWDPSQFLEALKVDFDVAGAKYRDCDGYDFTPCEPESEPKNGLTEVKSLGFGFVGFSRKFLEKMWLAAPTVQGVFGEQVREVFRNCTDSSMCEDFKKQGATCCLFTNLKTHRLQRNILE